jgi:hypothetical protein
LLLVTALWLLIIGWSRSIPWATFLAVVAYIHGKWLPCQFTILDEGLSLRFPFGRRVLLPKKTLTIRLDLVSAIALVGRRRRFGYPLVDRMLYDPGRCWLLQSAFRGLGYNLA